TALDHEPLALPAAHLDPAGHAEVKAGPGTLVELEPEVLAMAMGRDHPAPDEPAPDSRRAHTLEHDRVGRDTDGDDAPADGGSRQRAAGGSALGRLGLRVGVPEPPARVAETLGRRT